MIDSGAGVDVGGAGGVGEGMCTWRDVADEGQVQKVHHCGAIWRYLMCRYMFFGGVKMYSIFIYVCKKCIFLNLNQWEFCTFHFSVSMHILANKTN